MDIQDAALCDINLQKDANATYVGPADKLIVLGWNANASVTALNVVGRILGLDGKVKPFANSFPITSTRAINVSVGDLGEGWLMSVEVSCNGSPFLGQVFTRVALSRSSGTPATGLSTIVQGPIGTFQAQGWPGGQRFTSLEAPGVIRSITGTNPAAGAEISETVPTGARWRVLGLAASLVTSATVANRAPVLTIDDGATPFFVSDPGSLQAASLTYTHSAGNGVGRAALVSAAPSWSLPMDLILLAGHRIRTVTANLQAGDDWGAPQLFVQEWLEAK